jgi:two-component system, OmpR family, response regulator
MQLQTATATRLPHILMVNHDPVERELVSKYLASNDLSVTTAADVAAMRALLEREVMDLVLLDPKLRGEDGMDIARRLREDSAIPIVILSGASEEADRVMALELGADDYVTKPCSLRELLARVRAILRRGRLEMRKGRVHGVRAYRFDGWELNVNTRLLSSPQGLRNTLTNGEFSLLVALLTAGERVLSRMQLLELSRLHDDEVYDRAVDVQVMRLRRKLGDDGAKPRYILTMRSAGYRFGVPVEGVY